MRQLVPKSFKICEFCSFMGCWSFPNITFEDPSDSYWCLNDLISSVVNLHAPVKTRKKRANEAPYVDTNLKRALREEAQLRKKYLACQTDRNWHIYRKLRNHCTTLRRQARNTYFKQYCEGGSKNSFINKQ